MSTTETAPQKQGGCNRIKTVLQRESKKEERRGGSVGKEKERKRETTKGDKEKDAYEHKWSGIYYWLCNQVITID